MHTLLILLKVDTIKECLTMKIGNVVKMAIKWAPVIYPVVKKLLDSKNSSTSSTTNRRK